MSENVNPLSLIRAFGQWCEVNHLDPMTKLLWYELYQLFNRLGWPEWVQIDLPRLAVMIGSKREQTAIGHRDTLINRGLLGYRKGGKGDPSRYNLKCPTLNVGQSVGKSVGEPVGQSVGESVGEPATIYRLRQDKDINDNPPLPPKGEKTRFDEFWQAYPKKKNKGDAEKAWKSIKHTKELDATMLAKLAQARTCYDWTKEGGQYIPYPATWLRAKGWEDEVQPGSGSSTTPKKTVVEQQYNQRTYDPAKYSGLTAEEIEEMSKI